MCVFADTMDSVKDVLGKMGKRFGEAARKTENITGNFWQHCELRFHSRLFTKFSSEAVILCFPSNFITTMLMGGIKLLTIMLMGGQKEGQL